MSRTTLLIDGENFMFKFERVLRRSGVSVQDLDISKVHFNALFRDVLSQSDMQMRFYIARLHVHKDDEDKSNELISFQKQLVETLTAQGFEIVVAGNVRAQKVRLDKESKIIFREKGVDVQMAVDMVSLSADREVDTLILCSSDSDLQPAVKEAQSRGVRVIYLGFQLQPNRGLTHTTDETSLIRNTDILRACGSTATHTQRPARSGKSRSATSGVRRRRAPKRARRGTRAR